MSLEFDLDTSEFDKNMGELLRRHPAMSQRVMSKTIEGIKRDSDNIRPRTPHLWGHLRADWKILIISESEAYLIFEQKYAFKWHEVDDKKVNWSERATGVGSHYVESKLFRFARKYGQLMASLYKSELENV